MSNKRYYTVYLNATDEIVASGTAIECAEQMKKSLNCFYSLVSKNTLGVQKRYTVYYELLDAVQEEDDADDEKN